MADKKTPKTELDFHGEKIHWQPDISYGQYLELDQLLACQKPRSKRHDEMLFIIIHQASELWMKLLIHELEATMADLRGDALRPAFKKLARVARVQAQLLQSWEVLATMTPADYLQFRDALGKSSGFQSFQYRTLEFLLGNKEAALLRLYESAPAHKRALEKVLKAPSLYDESLRLLARGGLEVPDERLERDWTQPYRPHKGVEAAWLEIYRNAERHFNLYELAEKLVDVEYRFQQWRFAHLKTVERIIGAKPGTGGSSGLPYLTRVLEIKFFPELLSVRTAL